MPDTICSNGPYMISTDPIFTDEIQYYSYPAGFIEDNGQIRNSQIGPGISYWFAAEVTNDSGCMTDSIKVLINNDTIHVAIIDLDPTGIGLRMALYSSIRSVVSNRLNIRLTIVLGWQITIGRIFRQASMTFLLKIC